jgi:hypothetical protein
MTVLAGQLPINHALLAAGDLDGDGVAEAIYVGLDPATQSSAFIVARASQDTTQSAAPRINLALDAPRPVGKYAPGNGQIALADIDGDGRLDLALLAADAPSGQLDTAATHVTVLWNDGSGSFDTTSPLVVSLPMDRARVSSFALLARGAGRDLVIATERGTMVARGNGRAYAAPAASVLPGATGVWAGDVTGDGIEDLALLERGSLRIYRGVAVDP